MALTPISSAPISFAQPWSPPPTPQHQPLILLSPRESDRATITASSEVASLPATNLQNIQPRKVWRSTGTSESLLVRCARPVAANALAFVGINWSGAAILRMRASNDETNVVLAPDFATDWISAWPVTGKPAGEDWPILISLLVFPNDVLFQYWLIEISDPAVTPGYMEAGRLALGRAWQPSHNFDFGGTPLGFDPVDVQVRTNYGATFTDRRNISAARTFELTISALSRREAFDGIYELQRLAGLAGDVICCLDPGETTDLHRFTMQGAFTVGGAYDLPAMFDDHGSVVGAAIKLREFI